MFVRLLLNIQGLMVTALGAGMRCPTYVVLLLYLDRRWRRVVLAKPCSISNWSIIMSTSKLIRKRSNHITINALSSHRKNIFIDHKHSKNI